MLRVIMTAAVAVLLTLAGCQKSLVDTAPRADTGSTASNDNQAARGGGTPQSGELPAWVKNPPSRQGYAYGLGSAELYGDAASALNRAKDDARAEVIKAMRVNIASETTSRVERTTVNGESSVTRALMSEVRSRIPETEISNIDMVEQTVSRDTRQAYVLAQLDRRRAERNLRSKLDALDGRLARFRGIPESGDKVDQLKQLLPALELLEQARGIEEKLDLVAVEGFTGPVLSDKYAPVRERIVSLLDGLVIVLDPRGDTANQLNSELRRALLAEGMHIRQGGEGDIRLRYEAELREVTRGRDTFVFADGNTTVLDADGRIIGEFRERVKGAATDKGLARDRALEKLAGAMGKTLGKSLLDAL